VEVEDSLSLDKRVESDRVVSRRQRRALDLGTEFLQEVGDAALDLVDIRDDVYVGRTARHGAPSIAPRLAPRTEAPRGHVDRARAGDDEDWGRLWWGRLWWIRLRGRARVLDDREERERALMLLQEKYPQYRAEPPDGPVLAVDVTDVREWSA
jgi:hypothetical protein